MSLTKLISIHLATGLKCRCGFSMQTGKSGDGVKGWLGPSAPLLRGELGYSESILDRPATKGTSLLYAQRLGVCDRLKESGRLVSHWVINSYQWQTYAVENEHRDADEWGRKQEAHLVRLALDNPHSE